MLNSLQLIDFKSFADETLALGPFTLIVGANAAGKSNLRDALQVLYAVGGREYSVAEVLGPKYESGVQVWPGIRGGAREVARFGQEWFQFHTVINTQLHHSIAINPHAGIEESLARVDGTPLVPDPPDVSAYCPVPVSEYSFLHEIADAEIDECSSACAQLIHLYKSFRFLDLDPAAMRQTSVPGQTTLSHRGENLSSVLHTLCQDPTRKASLLSWVRALTPMDAAEFNFETDLEGRVRLQLIEANGTPVSAASASDGTLRFLAMAAALLSADEGQLYFFEELDNGIHPTRLHLLLQLIQQATRDRNVQVVATTHNPALLNFLDADALKHAALVFRTEDEPTSHIAPIHRLPGIHDVLQRRDLGYLHGTGWLEEAAELWLENKADT